MSHSSSRRALGQSEPWAREDGPGNAVACVAVEIEGVVIKVRQALGEIKAVPARWVFRVVGAAHLPRMGGSSSGTGAMRVR